MAAKQKAIVHISARFCIRPRMQISFRVILISIDSSRRRMNHTYDSSIEALTSNTRLPL